VLGDLWRRRAERRPVLIVIDEAHNVCLAEPLDPLVALATDHAWHGVPLLLVPAVAPSMPGLMTRFPGGASRSRSGSLPQTGGR
jgi:hypothetical protein